MRNYILLIEDDVTLAQELVAFLESNDFVVTIAQSGAEALQLLNSRTYTLCLLDVGLPDTSGFELCKKIRQFYRNPIIMLTAHDDEDDIIMGLNCGADDYVTKPFSIRVLLSRIATQIRRITQKDLSLFNALSSGELIIDLDHKSIFLSGSNLSVSSTEFDLCAILAQSDCQIMPRDLLLEKVWDQKGKFVDNNTLSVHVSRLRKKLGRYNGTPYIDTIKGIGYRWNISVYKANGIEKGASNGT